MYLNNWENARSRNCACLFELEFIVPAGEFQSFDSCVVIKFSPLNIKPDESSRKMLRDHSPQFLCERNVGTEICCEHVDRR